LSEGDLLAMNLPNLGYGDEPDVGLWTNIAEHVKVHWYEIIP